MLHPALTWSAIPCLTHLPRGIERRVRLNLHRAEVWLFAEPVNIAGKVIPRSLPAAVDIADFGHIQLVEKEIVTGGLDESYTPDCDQYLFVDCLVCMKHRVLRATGVVRQADLAWEGDGHLRLVEERNMSPHLRRGHRPDLVDVVVSVDSVVASFVTNIDSMLVLLVRARHD